MGDFQTIHCEAILCVTKELHNYNESFWASIDKHYYFWEFIGVRLDGVSAF